MDTVYIIDTDVPHHYKVGGTSRPLASRLTGYTTGRVKPVICLFSVAVKDYGTVECDIAERAKHMHFRDEIYSGDLQELIELVSLSASEEHDQNSIQYKCQHCDAIFANKTNLNRHQKNAQYCIEIQGKTAVIIKSKENECQHCQYTSRDRSNFKRHMSRCSSKVNNIAVQNNTQIICT